MLTLVIEVIPITLWPWSIVDLSGLREAAFVDLAKGLLKLLERLAIEDCPGTYEPSATLDV